MPRCAVVFESQALLRTIEMNGEFEFGDWRLPRRDVLARLGAGFGGLALAALLGKADPIG